MDDQPALAFIGIGSNLQPRESLVGALTHLAATPGISISGISTIYRTAPLPPPEPFPGGSDEDNKEPDPDFFNGVLELRTGLSARDLLARLFDIETALGRKRTSNRYAPRTIDLDLLLFGRIHHAKGSPRWEPIGPAGILLHDDVTRRAFVTLPLLELAPSLTLPPEGKTLAEVAAVFDSPGGTPEMEFTATLRIRFLDA